MSMTLERYLLIAALILICFLAVRGCTEQVKEKIVLRDNIIQRDDSLQHWKDVAGREHGRRVLAEADAATIHTLYRQQVDSLVQILGIRESQLQSFALVGTETKGRIRPKVDTIDKAGTRSYDFSYSDRWLDIQGNIGNESYMKYTIRDSLGFITYSKRKWFLGRRRDYIDVYSFNPNAHVTGMTGARIINNRPQHFSIGPYIGYGFDGQRWAPSIGLSLQYSLIKF